MTDIDRGTRAVLRDLRVDHDLEVRRIYKRQRALGREPYEIAEDPELQFNLDAVDAILAITEDR
jgi:hypothetical protein